MQNILRKASQLGLLIALLCAGSMWFYVQCVLIPRERADAAMQQRPRGNLSDLYPRWWGARELLLHRRNPYSEDITLEIQKGYYGRVLDPARPNDPKDQQGFAYPVYVVFLLAPLIGFPFHGVQIFFYWLLLGLTAASVWLWLRVLRWRLPLSSLAIGVVLTLGSFPAVQGIKLQQLSLLVAAMLAGATACAASGRLFSGGVLLALATVKPQLAAPLVAWLLIWAISNWRVRRRLVFGFGTVMGLLLGGAEVVVPGWWRMFADAVRKYHRYTQNQSVLDVLAPWGYSGRVLAGVAVLSSAFVLWKLRDKTADTAEFGTATALVMSLTVLVVPMYAPYNQVLLLPAILVVARDRARFLSRSRAWRSGYLVGALLVGWQWVASLNLSAFYLVGARSWALEHWTLPFFSTFAVPLWIFALNFFVLKTSGGETEEHSFVEAS
ncbi:MAG: glycosyltransferase family 87 protein [Candidatus Sulfotelmatobacter sp.]